MAWAQRNVDAGASRLWLGIPKPAALTAFAASVWALFTSRTILVGLVVWLPHVLTDHVVQRKGFAAGGIWPQTLGIDSGVIAAHRDSSGGAPVFWSTYAGWAEARSGVFHPSFDYIIHALGPENRRAYLDRFHTVRPRLVQTILPTYTPYEPWLENTNWDLYRELLRGYVIADQTPWSIWWERAVVEGPPSRFIARLTLPPGTVRAQPGAPAALQLPIVPGDSSAPLTLLEIEVEYDAHNALQRLPIVGPSPRYLIGITGVVTSAPVTLDPYVSRTSFPLLARPGQSPVLSFQTFSLLPGARLSIRGIRVFVVPIDPRNVPWLQALAAREGA
jgi:hypothetical protein